MIVPLQSDTEVRARSTLQVSQSLEGAPSEPQVGQAWMIFSGRLSKAPPDSCGWRRSFFGRSAFRLASRSIRIETTAEAAVSAASSQERSKEERTAGSPEGE